MERKQNSQKKHHDKQLSERSFQVGDTVITRNFSHGPNWIPGFITKVTGPLSYKVMLGDGIIVRRHVDQVLARPEDKALIELKITEPPTVPMSLADAAPVFPSPVAGRNSSSTEGNVQDNTKPSVKDIPSPSSEKQPPPQQVVATPRRSQRTVSKPSYLKDYAC